MAAPQCKEFPSAWRHQGGFPSLAHARLFEPCPLSDFCSKHRDAGTRLACGPPSRRVSQWTFVSSPGRVSFSGRREDAGGSVSGSRHDINFNGNCSGYGLAWKCARFLIVQELCESRGGRPGLSVLTSFLVSVDVKIYWTVLRYWLQLVPNMSTDIWGH